MCSCVGRLDPVPKEFVKVVALPPREKPISEMTEDELTAYCEALLDAGIFDNVPGLPARQGKTG